jgi:hypothetical protein
MRANFLAVAAIMLLLGLMRLFIQHDPWMGVPTMALGVILGVVHFIRVRRFKRYDEARKFD